jgi:hypothetical protein
MVAPLFFYQWVLLALVWFFMMLYDAWPSNRTAEGQRPLQPIQPPRKHSKEPKPFAGLTHKPPCAACEQDALHAKLPPPVPPEPRPSTNRRPRAIETSRHFCPHAGCRYRGWLGLGNLRANGHLNGGPWRPLHCRACQGYFPEHPGTIWHGKRVAVDLMGRVRVGLAEGLGIRATARVCEIDPNTVRHWLVEAAGQLRAFSRYVLCEVHVKQWQLAERYAVLRDGKDGARSKDEAITRLDRALYGVWTAMDPASQWLVVIDGGPRTLAMAPRVVHQVIEVLAPGWVPLFLTDGLQE